MPPAFRFTARHRSKLRRHRRIGLRRSSIQARCVPLLKMPATRAVEEMSGCLREGWNSATLAGNLRHRPHPRKLRDRFPRGNLTEALSSPAGGARKTSPESSLSPQVAPRGARQVVVLARIPGMAGGGGPGSRRSGSEKDAIKCPVRGRIGIGVNGERRRSRNHRNLLPIIKVRRSRDAEVDSCHPRPGQFAVV